MQSELLSVFHHF